MSVSAEQMSSGPAALLLYIKLVTRKRRQDMCCAVVCRSFTDPSLPHATVRWDFIHDHWRMRFV